MALRFGLRWLVLTIWKLASKFWFTCVKNTKGPPNRPHTSKIYTTYVKNLDHIRQKWTQKERWPQNKCDPKQALRFAQNKIDALLEIISVRKHKLRPEQKILKPKFPRHVEQGIDRLETAPAWLDSTLGKGRERKGNKNNFPKISGDPSKSVIFAGVSFKTDRNPAPVK